MIETKQQTIPKGWNSAKLGDLCSFEVGLKVKTNNNDDYLEIGDVDIFNKQYNVVGKDKKTIKGAVKVAKNILLISKVRPTRGAITITNSEINISPAFCRLKITNKFFYYIVSQDQFLNYLGSQAKGSTYPTCKDEDVLGYELIYPTNSTEQQKIANVLSTVDDEIQKTEEIISQTEKLKNGLMQYLFIKGIRHKKFKKTEIGTIPEEWKILKLSEVAKVERGKFSHRPRNAPEFYGGDIPFIQTGDVVNSNGKISSYTQTLNEKGLSVSKLFKKGTIVITIAANIGDTGILQFDSCFPDSLIGITPSDKIGAVFLEYYLRTKKEYLNSISTQSAQKNINLEKLNPLLVVLPAKDEQQKIADILSSIDNKITVDRGFKDELVKLKKGLMQDLLSGKVRTK